MPLRTCRVSFRDVDGLVHSVEVQGETLFDAAAAAIATFKQQGWAAVVPVAAVERWANGPRISPKEELTKRRLR